MLCYQQKDGQKIQNPFITLEIKKFVNLNFELAQNLSYKMFEISYISPFSDVPTVFVIVFVYST